MIISDNDYEPGVLNTLCANWVKNAKLYWKNVWTHLPPRNLAVFERQYLLEYYTQRSNFSYFLLYVKPYENEQNFGTNKVCMYVKLQTVKSSWIPLLQQGCNTRNNIFFYSATLLLGLMCCTWWKLYYPHYKALKALTPNCLLCLSACLQGKWKLIKHGSVFKYWM